MAEKKTDISFREVSEALQKFVFPETDVVVGIATGGIYPAVMVAHQLKKDFRFIHINFRDPSNKPVYDEPKLFQSSVNDIKPGSRVLLVDEVSVSGKTMDLAKSLLQEFSVTTFVLKGKADYVLFPGIKSCVNWPWKV